MTGIRAIPGLGSGIAVLLLFFLVLPAGGVQLVSQAAAVADGAGHSNGDSGPSIISADGRYVLFSSSANNLVATTNGHPLPLGIPAPMNVYLRDRSNNVTTLVSVNIAGNGGNGDSFAMGISTNGRYALFESAASDLVPGDTNNANDVFVRDIADGATALVSISTNGGCGDGASRTPVMTPDGRYVAFVSSANNLVANDTNGIPDVFVRDLQSGTTTLASVGGLNFGGSGTGESAAPAITPDGRYVVFLSSTTNPVPGNTDIGGIYVRDLVAGATYCASSGAGATLQAAFGNTAGVCFSPRISNDGAFVAYEASPSDPLLPNNTTGVVLRCHLPDGATDVIATNANSPPVNIEDIRTVDLSPDGRFVAATVNTDSGGVDTAITLWNADTGTNLLASPAWGTNLPASGSSYAPVIDPTGRYIAFLSNATNLTTDILSGETHLYYYDAVAGAVCLADADTNGTGVGVSAESFPSWSADAQFLAYESAGASDRNQYVDVMVYRQGSRQTEIVSAPAPAFTFPSADGPSLLFAGPMTTTARYAAFVSDAHDLADNATNGYRNVLVGDLVMGSNVLVSVNTNGSAAAGNSSQPSLSADGRWVAFASTASDLVPGDTNNSCDVFVRDIPNGITTLVSINTGGTGPGNANSFSPTISSDGRFVMFFSLAQNLAPGLFGSGTTNLFVRDRQTGITYALTEATTGNGIVSAAMTPDGHYVAFIGILPGTSGSYLYVWDSSLDSIIYTNTTTALTQVTICPEGGRLACLASSPSRLFVDDLAAPTNDTTVCTASFPGQAGLSFSSDGRFLAYATNTINGGWPTNGLGDVYIYDVLAKSNQLMSASLTGSGRGNAMSDSPVLSPDGRFVAYRSFASNLAPAITNGLANLFVYDRYSGTTTVLTASIYNGGSAANRSSNPYFSPDGQTILFQSAAFDLVSNNFNRNGDIFAFNLVSGGLTPVFRVQAFPSANPNLSPTFVWPVLSGKDYQIQFKQNLSDSAWQPLPAPITIFGNTAHGADSNAGGGQRFYRIIEK